ncbi:hypothetical protein FALBO_11924 [Fusarium albosuccineum]|uniref:Uncharacterized protein n=1 Tax=Fusarium albosuccineum TaxID=1237068 RepID=A0A8H4L1N2_9HYPO|nr:hypothetical protein FALBO_11924 [Fusarium albosuccineum]
MDRYEFTQEDIQQMAALLEHLVGRVLRLEIRLEGIEESVRQVRREVQSLQEYRTSLLPEEAADPEEAMEPEEAPPGNGDGAEM